MKNLTRTVLLLLILNFTYSAFGRKTEIPNYILAQNSNFIVNIYTVVNVASHTVPLHKHKEIGTWHLDPKEYSRPDDDLFNYITSLMDKEFEKLNMHPKAYINSDVIKMEEISFMKYMMDEYNKVKPGFIITVVVPSDWKDEKEKFKKNKLELKDVKGIVLSISKYGEKDYSKTYNIFGLNLSLEKAFSKLGKNISKKSASYFLEEMEINEELYTKEFLKYDAIIKSLTENETFENFPEKDEINEHEILVVAYDKKDGIFYENNIKKVAEYYPKKFKFINTDEYLDYRDNGYKYVLIAKSYYLKRIYYEYDKEDVSVKKLKEKNTRMFYYVLKDLETNNIYYRDKKEIVEEEDADSFSLQALKKVLFYMTEHYNLNDKE